MIPVFISIKNKRLPDSPGVYFMKDVSGGILYIGKAGNLKRRVTSYFTKANDARIEQLLRGVRRIDYQKTDTALEALMLESELIKKHQPPYNIREKDDKSFLYVQITEEKFPRVLLVRGKSASIGKRFGPFTSASAIREALRILRKIFPWSMHAGERGAQGSRACFEYEIGLCPGTCIGAISRVDYMKNIRHLVLFFGGKKERIISSLEREMKTASKNLEFEKAARFRGQLFALRHIQDVALITDERPIPGTKEQKTRIEGYDISNISGTSAVGSMVVFVGGKPDTNEYRKFKIKTIHQSDDVGMLKEVLRRRLKNNWPLPDVILVDGGRGQVNGAKQVLSTAGIAVPVLGIAKGPERKRNDIIGFIPKGIEKKTLIRVRDEAHRFAISYHKQVRAQKFLQ